MNRKAFTSWVFVVLHEPLLCPFCLSGTMRDHGGPWVGMALQNLELQPRWLEKNLAEKIPAAGLSKFMGTTLW